MKVNKISFINKMTVLDLYDKFFFNMFRVMNTPLVANLTNPSFMSYDMDERVTVFLDVKREGDTVNVGARKDNPLSNELLYCNDKWSSLADKNHTVIG